MDERIVVGHAQEDFVQAGDREQRQRRWVAVQKDNLVAAHVHPGDVRYAEVDRPKAIYVGEEAQQQVGFLEEPLCLVASAGGLQGTQETVRLAWIVGVECGLPRLVCTRPRPGPGRSGL